MLALNYITNEKGEKTHLFFPISPKGKVSLEEIEDIQDIIAYELLKNDETLDYHTSIAEIIRTSKSLLKKPRICQKQDLQDYQDLLIY